MPSRSRAVVIVSALLGCAVLAACTSGTNTDPPPSGSSATSSSASPSSSVPSRTTSSAPSRSTSSKSTKPVATPTVQPAAQAAVNSYMQLDGLVNSASRDPAHADTRRFSAYAVGAGLTAVVGSIEQMKKYGLAYRGTPPDPRIKVVAASAASVVLSSCPLAAASDPFVQYVVATGRTVPIVKRTPPPPYVRALTMHFVGDRWKLASVAINGSKTCTP